MKRILIVGISGTGKSRLAQRLHKQTGIPVTFFDNIAWKSGWAPEDPLILKDKIKEIIDKDEWIVEGYIEPLASERVARADTIIYLDYPGYLTFIGGIKRWWKYRGKERPEMQPGNKEEMVLRILWSMLMRSERPEIEKALLNNESKVIRIKSWGKANSYRPK